MECEICNRKMEKVNLVTGAIAIPPYVCDKKKGVFEYEKRSYVSCYVCTKCGKIQLIADTPEIFEKQK
ncbi:MAG: hypothetical protein ACLUG9_17000 [Paraclostridium sordellii]|uniref:hypothetical protein n=1 Tax=Paraclostridium sordellii TaxID=1505 RepID=UPI0005E13D9F|nr:hypothetical protein [Paeniclostridium sordellii]MVO75957.1 hypothetical protein [Paeniclostridium sordellii]CEN29937.1 Uncharacterised protein [[Clostridium] sordellii] [Paeniclostridium sordellii]CEN30447.1 Uncharacterised protein [[Clostridium] sordellii] [Paeniclostridium sordellii]